MPGRRGAVGFGAGRGYVGDMVVLIVVLLVLVVVLPLAGWALWLFLSAALVGAIIGGLARLVLPGRQEIGVFSTVVIGWIGSLIGSALILLGLPVLWLVRRQYGTAVSIEESQSQ